MKIGSMKSSAPPPLSNGPTSDLRIILLIWRRAALKLMIKNPFASIIRVLTFYPCLSRSGQRKVGIKLLLQKIWKK